MKRSAAPSVLSEVKKQKEEELAKKRAEEAAIAAAAGVTDADFQAVVPRTLRGGRVAGAQSTIGAEPQKPLREYIDVTGKKKRGRGAGAKKWRRDADSDAEGEEAPVLNNDSSEDNENEQQQRADDDSNSASRSTRTFSESNKENADPLAVGAEGAGGGTEENGTGSGGGGKPKQTDGDDLVFEVQYHQKKTGRGGVPGERETHQGVLKLCRSDAVLFNRVTGREITRCSQVCIEILEGMAVKMNLREIDVGPKVSPEQFYSGTVFLQKKSTFDFSKLTEVPNPDVRPLPSYLRQQGPQLSAKNCKSLLANSRGFTVPWKGTRRQVDNTVPKFDPDQPNAVVLYRPQANTDRNGKPLVAVVVDPELALLLRPHQKSGVQFLFDCVLGKEVNGKQCYGSILADEMGLGKTIQSVALVYTLLNQGQHGEPTVKKVVIVSPSSLVRNWCKEFEKWLRHVQPPKAPERQKPKRVEWAGRRKKNKNGSDAEAEEEAAKQAKAAKRAKLKLANQKKKAALKQQQQQQKLRNPQKQQQQHRKAVDSSDSSDSSSEDEVESDNKPSSRNATSQISSTRTNGNSHGSSDSGSESGQAEAPPPVSRRSLSRSASAAAAAAAAAEKEKQKEKMADDDDDDDVVEVVKVTTKSTPSAPPALSQPKTAAPAPQPSRKPGISLALKPKTVASNLSNTSNTSNNNTKPAAGGSPKGVHPKVVVTDDDDDEEEEEAEQRVQHEKPEKPEKIEQQQQRQQQQQKKKKATTTTTVVSSESSVSSAPASPRDSSSTSSSSAPISPKASPRDDKQEEEGELAVSAEPAATLAPIPPSDEKTKPELTLPPAAATVVVVANGHKKEKDEKRQRQKEPDDEQEDAEEEEDKQKQPQEAPAEDDMDVVVEFDEEGNPIPPKPKPAAKQSTKKNKKKKLDNGEPWIPQRKRPLPERRAGELPPPPPRMERDVDSDGEPLQFAGYTARGRRRLELVSGQATAQAPAGTPASEPPFCPRVVAIAESTKEAKTLLYRFRLPREQEGAAEVLCISYDQFRIHHEDIIRTPGVDLLVCDEGHRIKNDKIKTTQILDRLPTKRRIILSGTPIQNDLDEFFAMVNFVNPGVLGDAEVFRRIYAEPINLGRDPNATAEQREKGRQRSEALSEMTARFILRRTADINQQYLPNKEEFVVFCRLTELQQRIYVCVCESLKTLRNGDGAEGGNQTLRCITALKKLCNHPELIWRMSQEDTAETKQFLEPVMPLLKTLSFSNKRSQMELSGKMQFLDRLLMHMKRTSDDRIVVVSNYTETLDLLQRLCQERQLGYFRLDGDTAVGKRQKLVDQFNSERDKLVFFLSSKAGGVGLNLVGANRLVLFDPDWNPASDLQAMARVWRDGQKKQVYIYRLLSTGTIEEKIFQRQVTKQGLSNTIVDEKTTVNALFTGDDLRNLFTYNAETVSETHDLLSCTTCNADKLTRKQLYKRRKKTGMEQLDSWEHHAAVTSVDDELLKQTAGDTVSFCFSNMEVGALVVKTD